MTMLCLIKLQDNITMINTTSVNKGTEIKMKDILVKFNNSIFYMVHVFDFR